MTSDGDGNHAGAGWLKAATIVAAGFPALFGTFLGTVVEAAGLGTGTPGLGYSYWVQTYFFTILAICALVLVGVPWALVRRGRARSGGGLAVVAGLALTPLGLWITVTGWWLAGPLALVGGALALRDSGSG